MDRAGRFAGPWLRCRATAIIANEDNLTKAVELYEKSHIERTLGKTAGDKIRAAEMFGLSLSTLYRKIEKLGIEGVKRGWRREFETFQCVQNVPIDPSSPRYFSQT